MENTDPGRLARLEERVSHMPDSRDLQAIRTELGAVLRDENQLLRDLLTERLGNNRSAILSELAVDRANMKSEILAEFKTILADNQAAQNRVWQRISVIAGLLPVVIILALWLSGAMSPSEAAGAIAGAM